MTNPHLQTLMQKDMTRKEFLALAGLAVGSIFGMEHIIKLLTGKSLSTHANQTDSNQRSSSGYSSSVYGR